MKSAIAYIRLQLKLKWTNNSVSKKGKVFSILLSLAVFIVLGILLFLTVDTLITTFGAKISIKDVLILFVFIVEILLTFTSIGIQIKCLFKQPDAAITARFPVSRFKLFTSSLILSYLNIFIYTLTTFLPMMIIYGLSSGVENASFYGFVFVATFFAPLIPFSLALLVSVPIMYILSLLENKNIIKLILFIGAIVVFFIIYDYVLQTLSQYLMFKEIEGDKIDLWTKIIFALNNKFNPFIYVRDIMFKESILKGIAITLLISIIFSIAGLCISGPTFKYIHDRTLEGSQSVFNRKTKLTNDGPVIAMIKKEFKEIIRTKIYAYFYLGIAISTPVMVFFCNRLTIDIGTAQIGSSITLGASVLVLTAFMALINAFSASAINKEGDKFYITKIIPMKFTNQLLIKGLVNLIVSIGALIISCFVIKVLNFVTLEEMFVILFAELFMAIAMIFTGFNLNLTSFTFKNKADGDVDESNVTIMMIIGIILSAALTTITIFMCYYYPSQYSYAPILLIPFLCMVINISIFFPTCEKRYYKIEAK